MVVVEMSLKVQSICMRLGLLFIKLQKFSLSLIPKCRNLTHTIDTHTNQEKRSDGSSSSSSTHSRAAMEAQDVSKKRMGKEKE